MIDYWATSDGPHWAAVAELERVLAAQPGDPEARRRLAHALYAALVSSLSVTRDQTVEITSARQAVLAEQVSRRILDLDVDDDPLRRDAQTMLDRATSGQRWTWESPSAAVAVAVVAVVAGIVAAVLGGLAGNVVVVIAAAVLSSTVLAAIVLRYRRQNWRIQAERVAALIWRPGV